VLRKLFGPKRQTIRGEKRKLHNDEPDDLHSSKNIIRLMIFRGMRGGAYGTFGGEVCVVGNLKKDHLRGPRGRWWISFKICLE